MKTIAITNQKGGVGKTTTAQALINGLNQKGYKTLAIDMDPQESLTYSMGSAEGEKTILDALINPSIAEQIVQHLPQGDIIPASIDLQLLEKYFKNPGAEISYKLREVVEQIGEDYDFIIIDTPPALNILTINALTAADSIIVVTDTDTYALKGLDRLNEIIGSTKKYTNKELSVMGILVTRYEGRTLHGKGLFEVVCQKAEDLETTVFNTSIRKTVDVKEAQTMRQSLYEYSPKSNAAVDYLDFVDEVIKRSK